MAWRLAKSLEKFRSQINESAPNRSKVSDGTVGDTSHQARPSDHNPDKNGVVKAIDITHDPRNGVDCNKIAEALRASKDKRISYIIWNRRIWNPSISDRWRTYSGSNPHDKHLHLSVKPTSALYDSTAAWQIGDVAPDSSAPEPAVRRVLRRGDSGDDVKALQAALAKRFAAETGFGRYTEAMVKAFQQEQGLSADGIAGPYTMEKLS